jgi:hypothetical protein
MFIKDLSYISCQASFDLSFFDCELIDEEEIFITAQEPDYSSYIPKSLLRRMGKGVRMGIGCGMHLIARNSNISGIIIGTANGGLEDCIKFLNQIVDYNEGTLTPTTFVQSTPNAVAANLALMTENTCYNNTHVNSGLAFESALIDAMLTINELDGNVLVGAIEEVTKANINIDKLKGWVVDSKTSLSGLISNNINGTLISEGAGMFIVNKDKQNALAEITDIVTVTTESNSEVWKVYESFINRNTIDQLHLAFVLGRNGDDKHNQGYHTFEQQYIKNNSVFTYKNISGEFPTSISFALWLSTYILNKKIRKESVYKFVNSDINQIVIYNQTYNNQHSFLLVKGLL